jgi:hypothetical protein
VTAAIERRNVATAKSTADKGAGLVVVDQDARESACCEWFPAVKTIADIGGEGGQIVPELYDEFGNLNVAGWHVYRSAVLDQCLNVAKRPRETVGR